MQQDTDISAHSAAVVWILTPSSDKAFFFFFFFGFSFIGFSVISSSTVTVWGAAEEIFFSSATFTFFKGLFAPSSLTLFLAPLFLKPGCQADRQVTLQPVSTLHSSLTGDTLFIRRRGVYESGNYLRHFQHHS